MNAGDKARFVAFVDSLLQASLAALPAHGARELASNVASLARLGYDAGSLKFAQIICVNCNFECSSLRECVFFDARLQQRRLARVAGTTQVFLRLCNSVIASQCNTGRAQRYVLAVLPACDALLATFFTTVDFFMRSKDE